MKGHIKINLYDHIPADGSILKSLPWDSRNTVRTLLGFPFCVEVCSRRKQGFLPVLNLGGKKKNNVESDNFLHF